MTTTVVMHKVLRLCQVLFGSAIRQAQANESYLCDEYR